VRMLALFLIRQYQRWLSPFTRGTCRHFPSCSEYAAQAIERHGALHGAWLAARRVLRCHPFGSHGVDPVP